MSPPLMSHLEATRRLVGPENLLTLMEDLTLPTSLPTALAHPSV